MIQSEVEKLLAKTAQSNNPEDYEALFSAARGVEFFFNVSGSPTSSENHFVSTPLVNAGEGLRAVLMFTSKNNPSLKKPFGGIIWEKALEMVINMPQADGLIIQNNDLTWLAIDKENLRSILSIVR